MTVLAWHNDPELKAEALARMQAHRAADEFIQGAYTAVDPAAASGYRGCFHGCLTTERLAVEAGVTPAEFVATRGSVLWHDEGERLWGIPAELGDLLDNWFEDLETAEEAAAFAIASIEAIAVGADPSGVPTRFREEYMEGDETETEQLLRLLREAPVPEEAS